MNALRGPTVFEKVKIRVITFGKCMDIKSTASLSKHRKSLSIIGMWESQAFVL
jgi:hypothetical protein